MYRHHVVREPTRDDVADISEKWNLKMTDDEVSAVKDTISEGIKHYDRLMQLPELQPPVKYPRTPGYCPSPEENPLNAWYWRTDIQGASQGKLHGKTIAIKDNIAVASVPMMNGSKVMEGFVPDIDATIVTRILDAGGRITGKSSCEDLCFCASSFSSLTGPVLNPLKKECSAGGSSGGSGALVAAGHVDLAIGGDQGGSVRIPACWCGIVGMKPTHGLVPYTGAMDVLPFIDHLGPMAKTVKDCALLLEVIAGYDSFDSRQQPNITVPKYTEVAYFRYSESLQFQAAIENLFQKQGEIKLNGSVEGLKIGLMKEGFEGCEDNVNYVIRNAVNKLKTIGIHAEEVSIPIHKEGGVICAPIHFEGCFEAIFNGNGITFGNKGYHWTKMHEYFARGMKTRRADLAVGLKLLCCQGQFMKDNYDSYFYARACNAVGYLRAAYDKALEKYDVLVFPTIKYTAVKLPQVGTSAKVLLDEMFAMAENTYTFNVTGHPVLTLNAGSSEGMPVGISILGKHFDESTVLKLAQAIENMQ